VASHAAAVRQRNEPVPTRHGRSGIVAPSARAFAVRRRPRTPAGGSAEADCE
jgi:hypothetical protein